MEQRLHNFVLKEDGKIYWIDSLPKRAEILPDSLTHQWEYDSWFAAEFQSAIDSAVEVSNQEDVKYRILLSGEHRTHGDEGQLKPGKVYSLECSVEKKVGGESKVIPGEPPFFTPIQQDHTYPVALVTFSNEQKETEETQEELWGNIITKLELWSGDLPYLLENFTITRKPSRK